MSKRIVIFFSPLVCVIICWKPWQYDQCFGISIQTQWVSSILVQLAEWPGRSGLAHAACDMLDSKWVLENIQGLFDESPWRINTCSPHHVTETGTVWKFDKDMAQKLHWHQTTARTITALTFSSNNVMKWAKREISLSDNWAVISHCEWGFDYYYAHLQMQTRKEWVAKLFLHHENKAIIYQQYPRLLMQKDKLLMLI